LVVFYSSAASVWDGMHCVCGILEAGSKVANRLEGRKQVGDVNSYLTTQPNPVANASACRLRDASADEKYYDLHHVLCSQPTDNGFMKPLPYCKLPGS
jgi:hypothetical protein